MFWAVLLVYNLFPGQRLHICNTNYRNIRLEVVKNLFIAVITESA